MMEGFSTSKYVKKRVVERCRAQKKGLSTSKHIKKKKKEERDRTGRSRQRVECVCVQGFGGCCYVNE